METDERIGATLLGKLRVLRVLGRGGAGTVYEVEHLVTLRRHALKVVRPEKVGDPRAAARLLREASVAGRAGSPRLVTTHDVGQLPDGSTYVLMELLEGRSLADRLREGPLPPAQAVRLALQIAEGLGAAHAVGVVHRDLTPRNLHLVPGEGGEDVKILDFGLATTMAGRTDRFGHLTETGAVMGTPHYLSPEQARAEPVDVRTDQHALGLILYEALAGVRPYEGDSLVELLSRVVEGAHPPLAQVAPHVDPRLAAVVERAMHTDPSARYPNMYLLAKALEEATGAAALADTAAASSAQPGVLPVGLGYAPTLSASPTPGGRLGFASTQAAPRSTPDAGHAATQAAPLPGEGLGYAPTQPATGAARDAALGHATTQAATPAPPRSSPGPPAGRAAMAAPRGATPGDLPPATPSPRRHLWLLGLVAVAALVPLFAFGVTGLVLKLRGDGPAVDSGGGMPGTQQERVNMHLLGDMLGSGRYQECSERGERIVHTPNVLQLLINCASAAGDGARVFDLCHELAGYYPTIWDTNQACIDAGQPFDRGERHAL